MNRWIHGWIERSESLGWKCCRELNETTENLHSRHVGSLCDITTFANTWRLFYDGETFWRQLRPRSSFTPGVETHTEKQKTNYFFPLWQSSDVCILRDLWEATHLAELPRRRVHFIYQHWSCRLAQGRRAGQLQGPMSSVAAFLW